MGGASGVAIQGVSCFEILWEIVPHFFERSGGSQSEGNNLLLGSCRRDWRVRGVLRGPCVGLSVLLGSAGASAEVQEIF